MVKNRLCSFANWAGVMRSRPVALSKTAPVARWYRVRASTKPARIQSVRRAEQRSRLGKRTGGDEGEGGAGVDDAGGAGQDVRVRAKADRLVDAPELGCGRRARERPTRGKMRSHTQRMHMQRGDVIFRLALPDPTQRAL